MAPSPWTRKAQSVSFTSISLSQQCHVARSACLSHKRSQKQSCADTANFCYPSCVTRSYLDCLYAAQHCAMQVGCKFNGRGERKRKMQRKNKGAVALPPPLPSAPSSSTCTLQAARLPAHTLLCTAQQPGLVLGYQSIAQSHQLPTVSLRSNHS